MRKRLRLTLRVLYGGGQWHEFSGDVPEAGGEFVVGPNTAISILNGMRQGAVQNVVLLAHYITEDDSK